MKKGYKCEYCNSFFCDEEFAVKHENECNLNPKNKVENRLITKIAEIYEILPNIITSVLCELNIDTNLCINEIYRANEQNCYHAIYKHRNKIHGNFLDIKSYSKKEKFCKKSSAEYWRERMPKLYETVKAILKESEETK